MDLSAALKGISDTMIDYGKLLDDKIQILTSLQEDPNSLNIEEELQAKQKWCDEILEAMKTLPVFQKLAKNF